MAVTPAILLAKLQGLNISADVTDHPAVTTVEVAGALNRKEQFSHEQKAACADAFAGS